MEQKHTSNWGWMLYTDFFLSALGGGLLIIASLMTVLYGTKYVAVDTFLTPVVAMGLGSSLLLLDLGKPFRSWRVFTNPKSFLTIGASMITISIGLAVLLATFYLPILPWSKLTGIRNLLALLAALSGFVVAFYPGLLLGKMAGRPFWKGSLLAPLFLLSGLSTGIAAFCIIDRIWHQNGELLFNSLNKLNAVLLLAQIVGWGTYVYMKRSMATQKETAALTNVFAGGRGILFWGGVMGLGLIIPLLLFIYSGTAPALFAHAFVLVGAFMMRGFVVTADHGVPVELLS
ncbi:NrfD/PsrC family molybdoenzyme membrane anchor subunit [Thermodesulfobacteriota bacterium]